jgi:hypothetical protein
MEDAEIQVPMSSLGLDVTVPCEAQYLPVLRQLVVRAVEYIGYHESLRDELVGTIEQAMHGVFETNENAYTDIELKLATTDQAMVVRIRYLGGPEPGDGPSAIEHLLSRSDGDDAPLERLRRAMKTVLLGRESGASGADYCELTRTLPEDL